MSFYIFLIFSYKTHPYILVLLLRTKLYHSYTYLDIVILIDLQSSYIIINKICYKSISYTYTFRLSKYKYFES